MADLQSRDPLREALDAIIDGTIVKRSRHELFHDGADLTAMFKDRLSVRGYAPTTVAAVSVEPGERVPAFYVEQGTAHFGWVFWEQFTSWKIRKLWGSIVKNSRGDWEIQIPAARTTVIYANPALKMEMDIDHPPEL